MKSILILFNVIVLVTNNFAQTIKYSNEDNRVELKKTFIQKYAGDWKFRWSKHESPHRIIGSSIPQNFNAENATISEKMARNFIFENQYLFDIENNNLELWVNELRGNIRYLIFNQMYSGIPVLNARLDFRYRLDGTLVMIGNDAFSNIQVNTIPIINKNQAIDLSQIVVNFNETRGDYLIKEPVQYIWVKDKFEPDFHLVWVVELYVHSINIIDELPVHNWKIFVDAHTGDILEKIDIAKSAVISGFVTGNVKDEPYGSETSRGLQNVEIQVTGVGSTYTDNNGFYSIDIGESNRNVTVRMEGSYLNANNQNGSDGLISRSVIPGTTEDFHFSNSNSYAGERDTYFHGNLIHSFVKSIDPSFTGVDYEMPAYVNINDNCNAYWDGYSINMYSSGGGCAATDQMADVVYHEYGHGIQQYMYSPYDAPYYTGLGEGCADYWAMTLVNSPCLGNGFYGQGTCLRDGENTRQYPGDECGGGVHCLGEITMGSTWKMRDNLILTMGYEDGIQQADMLFYFAQTGRPYSEPDLLEEILIVDDNDGSIENGTPHYIEICDAFEIHNVECPISGPLSQLDYTPNFLYFEIPPEGTNSQEITIQNIGQPGSLLNYSIGVTPFNNPQDGPDSGGNFWTDSDNEENLEFEWIDISEIGVEYSFPHNDQAGQMIDIGFDFQFYNQIYNQCIINPNGWIGFGEDNTEWDNVEIPSSIAPSPAILGFWDDLNPVNENCNEYCSGEVYYHGNEERFVVWFNEVAHWWTDYENTFYNFQIVFYPSGIIHLNYNEIIGDYSATIGIQNDIGTSGLQVVNNENYIHNNHGIHFSTGPNWINTDPTYGELIDGEQENIAISVDASGLLPEEYSSYIIISSTGGVGNIPVNMLVAGSMIPGDVNGDEILNILDIVGVINFIVGDIIPEPWQFAAGDLNIDGTLNILDIVIIINIILDS